MYWLIGFRFAKFIGFKISSFLVFKVSWFLGFKVSMVPYQFPFHGFLKDIDPISEIFKKLLDGLSGYVGPVFQQTYDCISNFLRFAIIILSKNEVGFSLIN